MVTSIIGIVLALLRAIPIFDSWFQQLAASYLQMKIEQHDKEFVDATRSLIVDHDQRGLEQAASGQVSAPAQDQTDVITRPGKT